MELTYASLVDDKQRFNTKEVVRFFGVKVGRVLASAGLGCCVSAFRIAQQGQVLAILGTLSLWCMAAAALGANLANARTR